MVYRDEEAASDGGVIFGTRVARSEYHANIRDGSSEQLYDYSSCSICECQTIQSSSQPQYTAGSLQDVAVPNHAR